MANHYVSTAAELQSALTEAQSNGLDDVIHIAQGTYIGSFTYASTEDNDLSILGGYSADFNTRDVDATNTVLDANHLGRVLSLLANDSISAWDSGDIPVISDLSVDGVSLSNGRIADRGAGIHIETGGDASIANSIVSNNHNISSFGGGGIDIAEARNISIVNNIISDNIGANGGAVYGSIMHNSADDNNLIISGNVVANNRGLEQAGIRLYSAYGKATIVNNTIVNNISENEVAGAGVFAKVRLEATIENNIIWGNVGGPYGVGQEVVNNLYIYMINTVNINNNYLGDYLAEFPVISNISNNIEGTADPLFVDAANGDYRLSSDSPLIDQGAVTAYVTSTDLDGNIRTVGSSVDIGAYEYFNPIITGTTSDDILQGTAGIDNILTLEGADVVYALAGNDTITLTADAVWGAGYSARNVSNDSSVGTGEKITLSGLNRFSDVIDGGADVDTLILTSGNDAFFIDDVFSSHHSSLTLASTIQGIGSIARITNLEVINAGEGNDIVDLTSTNFILANAIEINGEAGNDSLWGSNGDDTIDGGTGDDSIFGGTGSDTLTGGTGSDAFQFTATAGSDGITDFGVGGDTIQLYYQAEDNHTNADLSLANGVLTWDVDSTSNDVVVDLSATMNSSDLIDLDALISFVEIV